MKISVVIPNYNGRHLLEKNLPRVIGESKGAEIIVVDDASTDGSAEFLKKRFPLTKVLEKKLNSGFSSTVNLGVKHASGDLIVLLNSDVYPKADYLIPLLPYFRDPLTFAVGMLHENIEEGKVILRGRGLGFFKRGFMVHTRGDVKGNDTFWVNGGAGIFRKKIWQSLGGLREIYDPFYWEDIDLSWRAVNAGYKIFFEPSSRVVHVQSAGAIRSRYTSSDIRRIAFRNQFLFVWLNLKKPRYFLPHLVFLPYHFLRIRDREFFLGFLDAVKRITA